MNADANTRRQTQKLQRAIVDGLADVKAQDIRVFNTEHLSPLFERVIVATGTSNRQTKALAASVRDAVREAGFAKPRIEGEEVGEWIIVDCGAAVAHIMQPAIRQYYQLESIWGEKPVRLRLVGSATPPSTTVSRSGRTTDKAPVAQRGTSAPSTAVPTTRVRSSRGKTGTDAACEPSAAVKSGATESAAQRGVRDQPRPGPIRSTPSRRG